jgi:hypothetical protein
VEYPHRRYILYLLSRRMNSMEVRADCQSKGLMPPEDSELAFLARRMGDVPPFWKPRVTRENIRFRRWLRDKGLLFLWVRDDAMEEAINFLYRKEVRKAFETIVVAHGNVEQARRELLVRYPEGLVPSEAGLEAFRRAFWDLGEMSPEGVFAYLEAVENAEIYLPALHGDLVQTYATLGLQQRLQGEVFLQNIMEAANQQVLRLRANPNVSGAQAAGVASLLKVGMEAYNTLKEDMVDEVGDASLKKDAADFKARVVQAIAIPSIDELDRDVIDADYAEAGATNVHRLPVTRD